MLNGNFWKKYFEVYDILNELIPYKELLQTIVEKLDIKNGEIILDAGAGTGNLAVKIEGVGGRVICLDSSSDGLNLYKKKKPSGEIVVGDLLNELPFKDAYFDKICSNNTIYTLPPEKRQFVFKELYRVLKPGGIIVVSNLVVGFAPSKIYLSHLVSSFKKVGALETVTSIVKFVIPTIKIFYYNYLIKNENNDGNFRFMLPSEQQELLKGSGFVEVSENISIYANQGVLNTAKK